MSKQILIRRNEKIIHAFWQDNRIVELQVEDERSQSLVGTVYIARVSSIVENINAAFVELGKNTKAYLSLEDARYVQHVSGRASGKRLCVGDEIVVQVTKDAAKTKFATVTGELSFSGRYLVLLHGRTGLHVSGKIKNQNHGKELKEALQAYVAEHYADCGCGFILRTNAYTLTEDSMHSLYEELEQLVSRYRQLLQIMGYRSCYSVLYRPYPAYLKRLEELQLVPELVVTDEADIYEQLQEFAASEYPVLKDRISLYTDEKVPLTAIYSMRKWMEEALSERVWLPSGGYLIIQPTEALTVIDVNSGKFSGNTTVEETYRRTNEEAAKEIACQLRLRNLSGIIIIDFVDMKDEAQRDQLMQLLRGCCRKDPVKTTVVDMTKLNLVEVTRQRTTKPLHELLSKAEI